MRTRRAGGGSRPVHVLRRVRTCTDMLQPSRPARTQGLDTGPWGRRRLRVI